MEGLIEFYSKTGDGVDFTQFDEASKGICYSKITCGCISNEEKHNDSCDENDVQVEHFENRSSKELNDELEQASLDNDKRRLLSCIVTIRHFKQKVPRALEIRRRDYEHFAGVFGLADYIQYACSNALGFDVVPRFEKGRPAGFYASVYAKNFFGFFFVYDADRDLTLGIFWGEDKIHPVFLAALKSLQSLALHPNFPLLAMAASINAFNQRHLETIRVTVARVETRTGYTGWGVHDRPMDGALSDLSALMSGFASSLAAHNRSVKLTSQVVAAVEDTRMLRGKRAAERLDKVGEQMILHVDVIRRRATIQGLFVELLLSRVQNQITALFNLMNRSETEMSIGVAQDSRTIAMASKHDSTSMKTLAAVTVVFLPGTFVASLFSMSMFDWQQAESSNVLTTRFWIYWVVTIPLTLATVCAWYVWINRKAAILRSEEQMAASKLDHFNI